MKTRSLASAISVAGAISAGAHAAVNTTISQSQIYINDILLPLMPSCPPPFRPPLTLTEFSVSHYAAGGVLCFDPFGPLPFPFSVSFNMTGTYVAGTGITFDAGTIDIDVQTTSGWIAYSQVNVAITNIHCVVNDVGHWGLDVNGDRINTTFGLHIPPSGVTSPLPGLTSGVLGGPGINDAACILPLFGQPAGLFLEGTITNEP